MRKREKAISTIVATILTINMAIVMGGVMVAWSSGLTGSYQGGAQVQYMLMGEKMQEAIVIENVWFVTSLPFPFPPGMYIEVFVRNVGVREAKLASLYVNGLSCLVFVVDPPLSPWPYTLPVGDRVTLGTFWIWFSGTSYRIVVTTARGNQARGEWTA